MKFLKIIIFSLLFLPILTYANQNQCSKDGYTIITINGMLTTPEGAVYNKKQIAKVVPEIFNKQKVYVDYVYNESHLLGFGDFIDAANQKLAEKFVFPTYDLEKMLKDLSQKVKTQKLLLVAHSQGNFYANDIYNSIVSKEGGVPRQSIAIYGIGTPTSYIAGGGRYILSSKDQIMNWVRLWGLLDVLPANVIIEGGEEGDDPRKHNLTTIYLKYEGDRIAKDIEYSLRSLSENNTQKENEPCMVEKKLSKAQKIMEVVYNVVDPIALFVKDSIKGIAEGFSILAKTDNRQLEKIISRLPASAGDVDLEKLMSQAEFQPRISSTETEKNPPKENKTNAPQEKTSPEKIDITKNQPNEQKIEEKKDENKEKIIQDTPQARSSGSSGSSGSGSSNNQSGGQEQEEGNSNPENNENEDSEEIEEPEIINPPAITLNGSGYIDLPQYSEYIELGAEAYDEKDGILDILTEGMIDTSILGIQEIHYIAENSSGITTRIIRVVNVIPVDTGGGGDEEYNPDLIVSTDLTLERGDYHYNNVIVQNNSTLKLKGDENCFSEFCGVRIVANNIFIEEGSRISGDEQGYSHGQGSLGPGNDDNNGASHGGRGGGENSPETYGFSLAPKSLGSGARGKRGGGAVWLEVGDKLINEGTISVNGGNHSSGGSMYVITKKLLGGGRFLADGGNSYSNSFYTSAGGGGRIAIYYEEDLFNGTVRSKGGDNCFDSCRQVGEDGTAGLFNSESNSLKVISSWKFEDYDYSFSFNKITLKNKSKTKIEDGIIVGAEQLILEDSSELIISGIKEVEMGEIFLTENSKIKMESGEGWLRANKIFLDDRSEITLSGVEHLITDELIVSNSSKLTVLPERKLYLNVNRLVTENGGMIEADAKGLLGGVGTPDHQVAGGMYGGARSDQQYLVYGSAVHPADFGSSGKSQFKRGGGVIHLKVNELINNGIISSSGGSNASGGSVLIEAENLSGSGIIKANGGSTYSTSVQYNPGGGGRVAVHYSENNYIGEIEAKGGCAYRDGVSHCEPNGTAGLIDKQNNKLYIDKYWEFRELDKSFFLNEISLNSGAKVGSEEGAGIEAEKITIDGRSVLTMSGGEIIAEEININNESILTTKPEKALKLKTYYLNIEEGSSIDASGKGYLVGPGTPEGNIYSGASYGGKGKGEGVKETYGSKTRPEDFGSGSGNYRGGGMVDIVVYGNINNNGYIKANGGDYQASGGSVYIETNNFYGSGKILARGSYGSPSFNGSMNGGGGRIAVIYSGEMASTLELDVSGGKKSGYQQGEEGTIYTHKPGDPYAPYPELFDYRLNGDHTRVYFDPKYDEPVLIELESINEVNWVSIQIKHKENPQIYKTFLAGKDCPAGSKYCFKNWDGSLSGKDKELILGEYQIFVKMRSSADPTKESVQELGCYIEVVGDEEGSAVAPEYSPMSMSFGGGLLFLEEAQEEETIEETEEEPKNYEEENKEDLVPEEIEDQEKEDAEVGEGQIQEGAKEREGEDEDIETGEEAQEGTREEAGQEEETEEAEVEKELEAQETEEEE